MDDQWIVFEIKVSGMKPIQPGWTEMAIDQLLLAAGSSNLVTSSNAILS